MAVFNNILAGAAGGGDAPAFSLQKSVRLNEDSDAHLTRTLTSAGNRKTWTWSCWFKLGNATNSYQNLFSNLVSNTNGFYAYFSNDILYINDYNLTGGVGLNTTRVLRDKAAWYHLVIRYDTTHVNTPDRVRIYINGVQEPTLGYQPNQDVDGWWNNAQLAHIGRQSNNVSNYNFDGYLADINFIDGQSLGPTEFGEFDANNLWQAKKFTGTYGSNGYHLFDFANESGVGDDSSGNNNDWTPYNITASAVNYANAVSAASNGEIANGGTPYWIDILPTDADLDYSGSDFTKVHDGSTSTNVYWVGDEYAGNGNVLRARFDLRDFPSISTLRVYGGGFSGYVAYDYQLLDSSKSAISGTSGSFGNTHTWHSITISGSPRYLEISCTSGTLRRLQLYAIEVNGTVLTNRDPNDLDVLSDVPTNGDTANDTGVGGEVPGNYATLNPLKPAAYVILSDGNLQHYGTAGTWTNDTISMCTFGLTAGKWYWEVTINTNSYNYVGIAQIDEDHVYIGADNNSCGYYTNNGQFYGGGAQTAQPAVVYTQDETLMLAYDADARKLWVGQNGTWFSVGGNAGDPANGNNPAFTGFGSNGEVYTPAISTYGTNTAKFNFGARPYAYTAPSGFKALCTTNLPTPTIADGSDYFDTKLYTGNSSTQNITGYSFEPDLVWIKCRSFARQHMLYDHIRDVGKHLVPESTDGEYTNTNGLTHFNSDGFSLGNLGEVNDLNQTYVAWAWDAGDDANPVTNTDGTLTSSVRASQTAGTSIVTYTGSGSATSVGHGLGKAPDAIIVKNRDTNGYKWPVYHSGLPNNESLALNLAWGYTSISDFFDTPSSTVFNISSHDDVNRSGDNFVAYCFSSVEGFSKFGTHVGTGVSGSPFVYLGFKPALLIIKKQGSGNWFIHDNKRPGYNQNTGPFRIATETELTVTTYDLDLLSNGFVMRTAGGDANGSGANFVYFAWAQNPFQTNGGLAR